MTNKIQIKRSTGTPTPVTLLEGELAYSENSDKLFIGVSGNSIDTIGGKSFVDKLNGIASGAEVNTVDSVNGDYGVVVLDADDISDVATTNKFTTAGEISKLSGIAPGATVGADWFTNLSNIPAQPSALEISNGNDTSDKMWSVAKVKSAVVAFAPASSVTSVHGRGGAVVSVKSDYNADQVDFSPYSDVGATDVQQALEDTLDLIEELRGLVSGLRPKEACAVATTANISLSGTSTIDGYSVQVGDRVLVKNQTSAKDNGIYEASAGAWSRTTDADNITSAGEIAQGTYVFIDNGTISGKIGYVCTSPDPIDLGTDDITWVKYNDYTTDAVTSVNGDYGVVVLDADDISDTSTTNKFTTAGDISKLSGIASGATVGATWGLNITSQPGVISQLDAEAGTDTSQKIWTAQRVTQLVNNADIDGGTF